MAKPGPTIDVILQMLLDRIKGLPNEEIARRHGYKPKGFEDMVTRYDFPRIEREIRLHILGQGAELSPEAVAINQESDERLAEYSTLIHGEITEIKKLDEQEPDAELTLKDRLSRVSLFETAARGVEGIRVSRLKIVTMTTDAKKKQKATEEKPEEQGYKSDYGDLANDDDDDLDEES